MKGNQHVHTSCFFFCDAQALAEGVVANFEAAMHVELVREQVAAYPEDVLVHEPANMMKGDKGQPDQYAYSASVRRNSPLAYLIVRRDFSREC